MSKRNNFVFTALHIVAWIIFVGLCIEAGGLTVNFIFSLYKPEFILMAAVIYVVATIFSRGVKIQNENDLTV